MDAKANENSPVKVGDAFISLDTKSRAVFYEVSLVEQDKTGATWIELAGMQFQDSLRIPLLYLDKSFARVNESTVKALFGERKRNGNAKQKTDHSKGAVHSIRREGQRRDSAGRTTGSRQIVAQVGTRRGEKPSVKRDDQNGRNRSSKRN